MLGALIPLQHHAIAGIGKILDCHLLARSCEESRPRGRHRKRTLGKLHTTIIGDRGVFPITQVAPVPDGHKADIVVVIVKTLTVGADIGALSAVQQGNVFPVVVEDNGQVSLSLTLPARDDADA